METGQETVRSIGGAGLGNKKAIEGTAKKLGHAGAMSNTQKTSEAMHYDSQNSRTIGDTRGQSTVGDVIGKRSAADSAGTTVAGQAEYVSYINWSQSFGRGKGAEAFASALGLSGVRGLSEFKESGSAITGATADWLKRQGFSEVASGMRVKDMSVDRDTGEITYLGVEGNVGANALNDVATGFKERGHVNAGRRAEAMADSLFTNETANVQLQYGPAGELATGHVKHGTEAMHYDVGQKRWIDQQVEGRDYVAKDVDKTIVDHSYSADSSYSEKDGYLYDTSETYKMGPHYDPNTMLNAVVHGGRDFDRLTGSMLLGDNSATQARRDAQHRALAEGLTKITSHTGSTEGKSRGSISLRPKFFGIGGGGELVEVSSEKEAVNLHLGNVIRMNESAWKESGGDTGQFNMEKYTDLRHEKFQSYYDALMEKVHSVSPKDYGANTPTTMAKETYVNNLKPVIDEITGEADRSLQKRIDIANEMAERNRGKREE